MNRELERAMEWDCARLVQEFYCALDEKRYEDLASLFVQDGIWNRLGRDLVGPADIVAAMQERSDWLTAHVVTNVRVSIHDESNASGVQYITLYRYEGVDQDAGPQAVCLPLALLRHRDKFVRVENAWKFKEKRSRAIMVDRTRVTHYDPPKR